MPTQFKFIWVPWPGQEEQLADSDLSATPHQMATGMLNGGIEAILARPAAQARGPCRSRPHLTVMLLMNPSVGLVTYSRPRQEEHPKAKMLASTRGSLFLATTTAVILGSRLSVLASAQEASPEIKRADKIRGAVLGSLLADSLSLGRSFVACFTI